MNLIANNPAQMDVLSFMERRFTAAAHADFEEKLDAFDLGTSSCLPPG
jgi:hypothetical protein